eukprot:Tbor_TRINITY_DN3489_c0_g1::TRINITY_DN3489_c0_g1_i1::g.3777::m.3777/K15542/PFS2; polyadenylation factor subunit 2
MAFSLGGGRGGYGPPTSRGRRKDTVGQQEYIPQFKSVGQRPVDYFCSAIHHVKTRFYHKNSEFSYHVPSHPYYCRSLLPVSVTRDNPSTALCTQWVHTSQHAAAGGSKFVALQWAPTGRWLLASNSTGEFFLFNGKSFAQETRTNAHEGKACKALSWGRVNNIIISGDDNGTIKMWLPSTSLESIAEFTSDHKAVKEICHGPGIQTKFATVGEDGSMRVWDIDRVGTSRGSAVTEEVVFEGHGNDVLTVDWHPFKSLIVTGGADNTCKLWDPKAGAAALSGGWGGHRSCLATQEGHSMGVTAVRWNPNNGNQFMSASRDGTIKIWDIRQLKEMTSFAAAHSKGVNSVAWHPSHTSLLVSSGVDGNICFWIDSPGEGQLRADGVREVTKHAASIPVAHDRFKGVPNSISCVAWAPMGHLLASAGVSDVRYFHRNKPGVKEDQTHQLGAGGNDLDALDTGGL